MTQVYNLYIEKCNSINITPSSSLQELLHTYICNCACLQELFHQRHYQKLSLVD